MPTAGHIWTILYGLRGVLQSKDYSGWNWSTTSADPLLRQVRLSGILERRSPERLLVILHGLGGSALSHYGLRLAGEALARGWSCLRLNARGSDRQANDFYHAALTADLEAALASSELAGFSEVALAGFSLGGHVALRYLSDGPEARIRAAATVCSPLDLDACARKIDGPAAWLYRRYLLGRLKEIYRLVRPERPDLPPVEEIEPIRTIRAWDDVVVAPRHGFAGAADYYARASAGPHLSRIATPTLFLASRGDPMVPAASLEPSLAAASPAIVSHWATGGGHVALPGLDLDQQARTGPEPQILSWLESRLAAAD